MDILLHVFMFVEDKLIVVCLTVILYALYYILITHKNVSEMFLNSIHSRSC
jgi:hypothetical protein